MVYPMLHRQKGGIIFDLRSAPVVEALEKRRQPQIKSEATTAHPIGAHWIYGCQQCSSLFDRGLSKQLLQLLKKVNAYEKRHLLFIDRDDLLANQVWGGS